MSTEAREESMEPENADLALRWLAPAEVCATWDADAGKLAVTLGDAEPISDARARLAFPLRNPETFVQLSNDKGERGGMLQTMAGLDSRTRAAIQAALEARYLIPCVTRVNELAECGPGMLRWSVETSRGPHHYVTESARESVRSLDGERLRVTDLEGHRFDIPCLTGLDRQSRDLLARFL
jgi:hypothetical protein